MDKTRRRTTSAPVVGQAEPPEAAEGRSPGRRDKVRLFLASFLVLFVELALIRWAGANVIFLSYFSNFVLLASFLGIGIGFLRARSKVDLFAWAPVALGLLVLFVLVFPVEVNKESGQLLFFGKVRKTGLPLGITLPMIFLAVAIVMAMIAEGLARAFVRFRPLDAYRLDILGALSGIAIFSLLSLLGAKPVAWGAIAAGVFVALGWRRPRAWIGVVGAVALVVMLGWESTSSDIWSPYYRITTQHSSSGNWTVVSVNGIPHQVIQTVEQRHALYKVPYERAVSPRLDNVLIIGAGTGSDVAMALALGAKRVDAVEIDPKLFQLGERLHPNHPYQDPGVHVHITDGRAFLEQTDQTYDLILFALPDSLTLVSGQASLRLESYLFTVQAIERARDHLRPSGVFAMYNFYRQRWLLDRLANTEETAFGHPPCVDTDPHFRQLLAMITIGRTPTAIHCEHPWTAPGDVQGPATDDHPFVYLKGRSIPAIYVVGLSLILLVSLLLIRGVGGPFRPMRGFLDLFFMGAAFLLLETKSVVQFALLFGTTWFVNALVFAGILLAVLAAIEVSKRVRFDRPALIYVALILALAIAWAVPPEALLALSFGPRFLLAVLIAFGPIFLANLVFANRFRDVAASHVAFAANLLGAMVGGVLEYLALITGYRALLLLVAGLYGLAFLTRPKGTTASAAEAPVVEPAAV
jgi:SAM-dependent methyltransferase